MFLVKVTAPRGRVITIPGVCTLTVPDNLGIHNDDAYGIIVKTLKYYRATYTIEGYVSPPKPRVIPPQPANVGNLTSLTPQIVKTGSSSLTSGQCKGQIIFVTATGTIYLPPVVIDGSVVIYSVNDVEISVQPISINRIVLDGVAGGNGKKVISASGAGDFVNLYGDSSAGWTVLGRSGTWTLEI